MKRYIKSSNEKQPYIVTFGWDEGGPESGPIWNSSTELVYAESEDAACKIVDRQNRWSDGYEGCWAKLATPQEVQEYEDEMRRFDEEFPDVPEEDLAQKEMYRDQYMWNVVSHAPELPDYDAAEEQWSAYYRDLKEYKLWEFADAVEEGLFDESEYGAFQKLYDEIETQMAQPYA